MGILMFRDQTRMMFLNVGSLWDETHTTEDTHYIWKYQNLACV